MVMQEVKPAGFCICPRTAYHILTNISCHIFISVN